MFHQKHRPGMKPHRPQPVLPAESLPVAVTVHLGGPLQSAVGGERVFHVEARTIQDMLAKLGEKYPQLQPVLAKSVTVVVDGQVYRGAWQKQLRAENEIYLLPPMQGG
jgi:sulfur-carrier protein